MLEQYRVFGQINIAFPAWTTVTRSILIALVINLGLTSVGEAKTFTVDEINGDPDYSMSVDVNGGKFLSETATWGMANHRAALFHCPSRGSVSVSVNIDYPLELEDVRVNGQPGSSIEENLRMAIDQTYDSVTPGVGLVNVTGWVQSDDEEWFEVQKQFHFSVFCYKPLHVVIDNFSLSFSRSVTSYKMTPKFVTDDTGDTTVEFTRQNWPDVGVQVVPEPPLYVLPESWARTDAAGRNIFTFRAEADFGLFDSNGLWRPPIEMRAVKGPYQLEYETGTNLPYTRIKTVSNVWYLGASGTIGDLEERLEQMDILVPGDRIQIGTQTTTSALLDLQFINGQVVRSFSGRYGGFIATVQENTIVEGSALMIMDVRNAVQELRDAPRRAGRMLIYKASGAALDASLGVPNAVGFVSQTPGGLTSEYLAKWGEQAYERGASANGTAVNGAASIEFFNNGSVVAENRADAFTLADESGRSTTVTPGSLRFIPGEGAIQGRPGPPITANGVWEAPEPGAWQIAPADGSTVTTPLPDISVGNAAPAALDWSSLSVRLDGVDITPSLEPQFDFELNVLRLFGTTPDIARLGHGEHMLTITGNTRSGELIERTIAFSVDLSVDTTAYAVARPYTTGVWLSWLPPDGAGDFQIFRAASVDGPYTLLNEAAPRQQPGFFDPEPLPENHYRIEGTYPSGHPMQPFEVITEWSLAAPAAPPPESVTRLRVERQDDALAILFDHSYTSATRWWLERSIDGGVTFEPLLPDSEETVVSGFRDRTVSPGVEAEYRVTPVAADGEQEGTPATATATLPVTPPAPVGLTLARTSSGAMLQWDPYTDQRAESLRVYRDAGDGFEPLSTFPAGQTEFTDITSGAGPVQYTMTAIGPETESSATASQGFSFHPPATESADIGMAVSEIRPREGDGVAVIEVTRTGNLSESAMAYYYIDEQTAVAGEDYTRTSGTLWFAPEQTTANIEVELLPDAELNWPNDQTFYVFLAKYYGLFGPSTLILEASRTIVRIDESDVLFFPDHDRGIDIYRSAGVADIVVTRAYPSDRDISVEVVVDPDDPGDALPGVDWVDTRPWQVSFEPGQPTAALTLDLLEDAVGERSLNLKLQGPQGGASLNEDFDTLEVKLLDGPPPARASVEVYDMVHRPAEGFAPGEIGCVDIDFENRGMVPTSGSVNVTFAPPVGFQLPSGSTLNELVSSSMNMDCFHFSIPAADPTVTCSSMDGLAVSQSAWISLALEAGWSGMEEVPFHASVGDVSRPAPDPAVCANDADRPGCGTLMIPVLEFIFIDGFEPESTRGMTSISSLETDILMRNDFESQHPACLQ